MVLAAVICLAIFICPLLAVAQSTNISIILPAVVSNITYDVADDIADNNNLTIRNRRQTYVYLCGTYPNQYVSLTPCNNNNNNKCPNNGRLLGVGCNRDVDCTRFTNNPVSCIQNCCCAYPPTTPPGNPSVGYCYDGQGSNVRCSAQGQCQYGRTCMNGLCCPNTGSEWRFACGGSAAIASCNGGQCQGFTCTPSNYCCECAVGRSSGRCNNGYCPSGFTCNSNGYCCASCPGNVTPYGSCVNGRCGGGATCRAGNLCCL